MRTTRSASHDISTAAATTRKGRRSQSGTWAAFPFLAPAAIILVLLTLYPILYTVTRSFFDAFGTFVGLKNYVRIVTEPRTLIALRNNAIWVAIAPIAITSLGLIFAVLVERIRWTAAFRMILFIPLVVSGLAAGVIFRFMFAGDPQVGFVNTVISAAVHTFKPPGQYPGARLSVEDVALPEDGGFITKEPVPVGERANFALAAIRPQLLPDDAAPLRVPAPSSAGIGGVVWLDFLSGGRGTRGHPDEGKQGLPGILVEAVQDDRVVATTRTGPDGSYLLSDLQEGAYYVRLSADNFRQPFGGYFWLGKDLIFPTLIIAYIWINTGFALMMIGAGLASINREMLEAARTEGANEWQVFRFVTAPALMPILIVVLIRSVISVLKIFDLVTVIAPESVQRDATVLALEMWNAAFGAMNDHGLGSALATVLFLLIVPFMLGNIRRFRLEQDGGA